MFRRILAAVIVLFMLAFASSYLVAYLHSAGPMIRHDDRTDTFYVTFPEGGYIWACTRFKSLKETIIMDGREVPYEPANCGGLAGGVKQTSYSDNWSFIDKNGGEWEVTAILQKEDATEFPSNTVTVIH